MAGQQQHLQLDEIVGAGVGVRAGDQVHVEPGDQAPVLVGHHDEDEGQQQGVQGAGALEGQPGDLQVDDQPVIQGGDEGEGNKVSHGGAKQKSSAFRRVRGVEADPPPFMLSKLLASKEFLHLASSRVETSSNLSKRHYFFTNKCL